MSNAEATDAPVYVQDSASVYTYVCSTLKHNRCIHYNFVYQFVIINVACMPNDVGTRSTIIYTDSNNFFIWDRYSLPHALCHEALHINYMLLLQVLCLNNTKIRPRLCSVITM